MNMTPKHSAWTWSTMGCHTAVTTFSGCLLIAHPFSIPICNKSRWNWAVPHYLINNQAMTLISPVSAIDLDIWLNIQQAKARPNTPIVYVSINARYSKYYIAKIIDSETETWGKTHVAKREVLYFWGSWTTYFLQRRVCDGNSGWEEKIVRTKYQRSW